MKLVALILLTVAGVAAGQDDDKYGLVSNGYDTSELLRKDKSVTVAAEVFGLAPLPGFGASAGVYLNRNLILEGSFQRGSMPWENLYSKYDLTSTNATVRAKAFVSNSFYVNMGANMRSIHSDLLSSEGDHRDSAIDATTYGLNVGIGNQWQYDAFTVGCEWVGLYQPVTKETFHKSYSKDQEGMDEFAERVVNSPNLSLLRLSLGVSF